MNQSVIDMLAENEKQGWPDPHFHQAQYATAKARAIREGAQWAQEELINDPSLMEQTA